MWYFLATTRQFFALIEQLGQSVKTPTLVRLELGSICHSILSKSAVLGLLETVVLARQRQPLLPAEKAS